MACAPVLHLGLDWYDWVCTIIIYQGGFILNCPYGNADGVFHARSPGLSGEAWLLGPLLLWWQAVCEIGAHVWPNKAGNAIIYTS
jgi:Mlc titration factor MtfA (ptsG expression regulator)